KSSQNAVWLGHSRQYLEIFTMGGRRGIHRYRRILHQQSWQDFGYSLEHGGSAVSAQPSALSAKPILLTADDRRLNASQALAAHQPRSSPRSTVADGQHHHAVCFFSPLVTL